MHLLVNELYEYQNARCNDKNSLPMFTQQNKSTEWRMQLRVAKGKTLCIVKTAYCNASQQ